MTLPTIALSSVMHIGHLDQRPSPKMSHEGSCLSVSLHPQAWRRIARLGGAPLWRFSKADGCFVDYHQLTEAHFAQAQQWAIDKGWVAIGEYYRVAQYDDCSIEDVLIGYLLEPSYDEALTEAGDEQALVSKATGMIPLPAMEEALGLALSLAETDTWVIVEWLAATSDADGIWWDDILDPLQLSAPRGGIFQHRVSDWQQSPVDET